MKVVVLINGWSKVTFTFTSNYDLNGVSRIFSSQARYFVLRSSGSMFVGVVNMVGLL